MKAVWKFLIPMGEVGDQFELRMPRGAEILHVAEMPDTVRPLHLALWALVDGDADQVSRGLIVHGTGHPADDVKEAEFIGTVVLTKTRLPLVFHFWDRGEV